MRVVKAVKLAMVVFFVFVAILAFQNMAKADDSVGVKLYIHEIDRVADGFVINGTVEAWGPENRVGIDDKYSIDVDIIIKNGTNARYPNFKKWAYEPESVAAYYPGAETVYVPGTGPGSTMTREEAYGRNVTIIRLFSIENTGTYHFEKKISSIYAGKMFRIQATLEWSYKGTASFWWAHRFFNDVAGEGILGDKYGFLYSYGVNFKYSFSNGTSNKFCWKGNWPDDGSVYFKFTKNNSYLAIPGGSIIGDSSVSGKITKDDIIIWKNSSSMPLEYTSIWGHALMYGSGEVSITIEMYDKNGSIVNKGWGNLTGKYLPSLDGHNLSILGIIGDVSKSIGGHIWKNKWEILRTTGGGLVISLSTGIPGFILTIPTKYGSRALGYIWDGYEDCSVHRSNWKYNSFFEVSGVREGVLYHSRGYVFLNGNTTSIYLAEGNATVTNETGSLNLSSGEYTVVLDGNISTTKTFNEDELKQQMGFVDTLWNSSSFMEEQNEESEESKIAIGDIITCRSIEGGNPANITSSFTKNDTVYVWVNLKNASYGDKVKWIFNGPNNISENVDFNVNWSGDGACYAWLALPYYNNSHGDWKTDIYINDKYATSAYFTVSEKSKKTPGFEFITFLAVISMLAMLMRRK